MTRPATDHRDDDATASDEHDSAWAEAFFVRPNAKSPVAGERLLARVVEAARIHDPVAAAELEKVFATTVLEGRELGAALGFGTDWQMHSTCFPKETNAAAARQIFRTIQRYEGGAWRREASNFPVHRIGTPEELCWRILTTRLKVLSAERIRKIISDHSVNLVTDPLWR